MNVNKPKPIKRPKPPVEKLRRLGLTVLAAAVAVSVGGAGTAGALGRYSDPSGDGRGATDVTAVALTHDASGQLLFTISTAGAPTRDDEMLFLFIDTDQNPLSGSLAALGAEYFIAADDDAYYFVHYGANGWDDAPGPSTHVITTNTGALISVNKADLGGSESFNFWVRTVKGDPASGQIDDAPDDGVFNYALPVGGPEIREVAVSTTPQTGPRAGRRFSVAPTSLTLPPGGASASSVAGPAPESYTCSARIGRRAIAGTGAGGCTFAIPKKAKKKRLFVTLTVTYQGAAKAVSLVYVIR